MIEPLSSVGARLAKQTLSGQLGLHELEIAARKKLLGFGAEDVRWLKRVAPRIESVVDEIVYAFYEEQLAIDEFAMIVGDAATLTRLHGTQRRYIRDLFSGNYGAPYVQTRLRIGLVHKRIGVAPKLFLSAMLRLGMLLKAVIRREFPEPEDAEPIIDSLDKLLNFDTQLVFDTYIHALLAELEATNRQAVEYAYTLEQQVEERTREVEQLSQIDPLTGLFNRRALDSYVVRDLANARRSGSVLALLYMDVDQFKALNDRHGHLTGDSVLEDMGRILRENSREGDLACRLGGDEFCVLMIGAGRVEAVALVERLQALIAGRQGESVTVSVGIALTGPR